MARPAKHYGPWISDQKRRDRKYRTGQGNVAFRIVVDPAPGLVAQAYRELGKEFSDWRPAWHRLIPHMKRGIAKNISSKGAAIGVRWSPNDPAYEVRPEKRGNAQLTLTGQMVAAFTSDSAVQRLDESRLEFGSYDFPQARAINFGWGSDHGGGASMRAFVDWNPQMQKAMLVNLDFHAKSLFKKISDDLAKISPTLSRKRGR